MHTTSVSLLQRLRQPGDQAAWERFVHLYTPLLYFWAFHAGLKGDDARDLVQDVFTKLVRKLPEFEYNPGQSFRGWLRSLTLNHWRSQCRKKVIHGEPPALEEVPAPKGDDAWWEVEYRKHLVGRAAEIVRGQFGEEAWRVFWAVTAEGRSAGEVAAEFQMTASKVYVTKHHVLKKLREELAGLME